MAEPNPGEATHTKTTSSPGGEPRLAPPRLRVIYDDNCALCRSLAAFGRQRAGSSLTFVSWTEFRASPEAQWFRDLPADPESVLLWDGLQLAAGPEAWETLLAYHPDLRPLGWLAERLGLARPVARVLNVSSTLLRRFCSGCGIYLPSARTNPREELR